MISDGSLLLVEVLIDEKFYPIGGMKYTKISLNNKVVEQNNINSQWRELFAGEKSAEISLKGIVTRSKAEEFIHYLSLSGEKSKYKIIFDGGVNIEGDFFINFYQRSGTVNEEEEYFMTLISSGSLNIIK